LYTFDFGNSIIIEQKGLSNRLQIRAKPKQLNGKKTKKKALFSQLFQGGRGGGQRKKDRKIALLSLYLLYLYHVTYENPGGGHGSPALRCRRPCLSCKM